MTTPTPANAARMITVVALTPPIIGGPPPGDEVGGAACGWVTRRVFEVAGAAGAAVADAGPTLMEALSNGPPLPLPLLPPLPLLLPLPPPARGHTPFTGKVVRVVGGEGGGLDGGDGGGRRDNPAPESPAKGVDPGVEPGV